MIIAYIPLLFVLIGLLMYGLCSNGKLSAIGFAMFQCAFLVTMFTFSTRVVQLFPK